MYRAAGPVEMRPVGETEFVAGIAAMSDSGRYGPTRVAAGIVGFADLTLGDRVEPVLEAQLRAGGGRFRGVRHSAAWDASDVIGNSAVASGPHLMKQSDFRAGLARLTALGLSLDAWVFHPQLADAIDLARAVPAANIIVGHVGGPLGYGPYTGKRDAVFASWKTAITELARCPNVVMKLGGMMMRLAAYDYGAVPAPPSSADARAAMRLNAFHSAEYPIPIFSTGKLLSNMQRAGPKRSMQVSIYGRQCAASSAEDGGAGTAP